MPTKPKAKKPEQVELDAFTEKYELLSIAYGDPVEFLFAVMADADASLDLRTSCARDLMSFRFPKLKALEIKDNNKGEQITLTINLTTPGEQPKKAEIDVTPPTLTLVGSPK
jgi:hypothetical protein